MYYKQIIKAERIIIGYLYNQQKSIRYIAREINRNVSTVAREIKRNINEETNYVAETAEHKMKRRQYHKHMFKKLKYEEFTTEFLKYYDKNFFGVKATYKKIINAKHNYLIPSLRQVFYWIKFNKWVVPRSNRLRHHYKKGGKRTKNSISRLINNKYVFPIWARPKYINDRSEPFHWELDLIIGKKASHFDNIVSLTERQSRYTHYFRVKSKNPWTVFKKLRETILERRINVKSITIDNGFEFAKIGILAKQLNIKIYVVDPYASFQRGSNEHANGLFRRRFKKGTNFNEVSDIEISATQDKINKMPRELFDWKNSKQIFQSFV